MQKWEYLVENFFNQAIMKEHLAMNGSQGWELVNVIVEAHPEYTKPANSYTLFFKRPKS